MPHLEGQWRKTTRTPLSRICVIELTRSYQNATGGKHHSPKNLAVSIAIEAAELMEHYQWDEYTVEDEEKQEKVKSELADVILYCLYFANATGIDIADAVTAKLKVNAQKYPAETFNEDADDPADYERIKRQYRTNA